jgi:hypothetical protein
MRSVRASTLIPGALSWMMRSTTWMARSSPCVLSGRRACVRRAEHFRDGFTVDILGVLRICPLRTVGYVSCFLRGVSAAVQFSAHAAFSMKV